MTPDEREEINRLMKELDPDAMKRDAADRKRMAEENERRRARERSQ